MSATTVFLIILAVIAALLLLVLLLVFWVNIRVRISYSNQDGIRLSVWLLTFRVFSLGGEQAVRRVRVSDYTLKKLNRKKLKKPRKKAASKPQKSEERMSLTDIISLITGMLDVFFDKYAHKISVRAVKLKIGVSATDAAATAILYGAVIQGVAYILELLNNITNLKSLKHSDVNVFPDYTSDAFSADIKIVLKLPVRCALGLLLHYLSISSAKQSAK